MRHEGAMRRSLSAAFLALIGASCGGRSLSVSESGTGDTTNTDGTLADTMMTNAESASASSADTQSTTGEPEFDLCGELLVAPWTSVREIDIVGDMDGDGTTDLAVFGRLPTDTVDSITLISTDTSQHLGSELAYRVIQTIAFSAEFVDLDSARFAGVGDVDANASPDVAVSAVVPGPDGRRIMTYVLLGSENAEPLREIRVDGVDGPSWILESGEVAFPGNELAGAVSLDGLGDLNEDGFDDIFVQPADGRNFWVVFGRADPPANTILGELAATGEGFRVGYSDDIHAMLRNPSIAGDVDANGVLDVVVPLPDVAGGRLAIVLNSPEFADGDARPTSRTARHLVSSAIAASSTGSAVIPFGDIDGTPGDDIWVSSPLEEPDPPFGLCPPEPERNSVYLMYGGAAGVFSTDELRDGLAGAAVQGPCGVGVTMVAGGDLDADGSADLALTTLNGELVFVSNGPSYVASGTSLSTIPHAVFAPCSGISDFGMLNFGSDLRRDIFLGPDVTADAVDDLIVLGAPFVDGPRTLIVVPGGPEWSPKP